LLDADADRPDLELRLIIAQRQHARVCRQRRSSLRQAEVAMTSSISQCVMDGKSSITESQFRQADAG